MLRSLLRANLAYAVGSAAYSVASLLLVPYLVNALSLQEYGAWALSEVAILLLMMLILAGLDVGLMREYWFLEDNRQRARLAGTILIAVTMWGSSVREGHQVLLKSSVITTLIPFSYMFLGLIRLDDVPAAARALGQLTGTAGHADSLAAAFTRAVDSARRATPSAPTRRVLLLAWEEPPIVIGGGSFQDELVTLAGAVNVFADLALPSAQVTVEAIAARDPDLIVLLDADGMPAWSARPEWQVVRAVRERRFLPVRGTASARPTLRALEGVRTLRDAFAETRP